ncbi:GNAT family N-acetyltransferase [Streptomyces sp. MI02-7b]|uniref:GNAT family N-acetyltransferase n=1 Tax=Streptomyces sp. MI02-7b TaxID=462941 RepID=UPI00299FB2FC|nr:GNAT family N-acetyltransferase [Streptomyces sp. MI02-7b]MDX3074717.1 GNAT family N-acetyltransferase [Streptomyces sp. MI02-7b]
MPGPELRQIRAFVTAFARRQAARTVELPGGFAVLDDAFPFSHGNNRVLVDGVDGNVDPEALPALADEALAHLKHRAITVLDDATGTACAGPLIRAGYFHSAELVMLHTGPVPDGGGAEDVDLDAFRAPLARRWRGFLPQADDDAVRQLVDRRETRRRGADVVGFIGARTAEGDVASWADLYMDPASGIAQIEDLITSEDHLGRGYADAVLSTALRRAVGAGCATRFLIADADDWPRYWYGRRGFTVIGRFHSFGRD